VKDSHYEELECVFDTFLIYEMKILLWNLNAKVGKEDIFKVKNQINLTFIMGLCILLRVLSRFVSKTILRNKYSRCFYLYSLLWHVSAYLIAIRLKMAIRHVAIKSINKKKHLEYLLRRTVLLTNLTS
jgi:hypothetical protein